MWGYARWFLAAVAAAGIIIFGPLFLVERPILQDGWIFLAPPHTSIFHARIPQEVVVEIATEKESFSLGFTETRDNRRLGGGGGTFKQEVIPEPRIGLYLPAKSVLF
jgi:hypothetical protein